MGPKVSVIIPAFNQEEFIGDAVYSALSQTYSNLEIVVSDDGSSDNTPNIINEIAARYPDKIIAICHRMNGGIASNLNRALARCSGELVAWLGGDDLMLPQKIEKQVTVLNKNPDAAGCCHDAEVFNSEDSCVLGRFSQIYNGSNELRIGGVELLFDPCYFMLPSTMMIRRKYIPQHGFDERLRYSNDWLFDVEVFRHGICIPINEVLCRYRRHASNITTSQEAQQNGAEDGLVALTIAEARYPELARMIKRRRAIYLISLASKNMSLGDTGRSWQYTLGAVGQGAMAQALVAFAFSSLFRIFVRNQQHAPAYTRSALFTNLARLLKRSIR